MVEVSAGDSCVIMALHAQTNLQILGTRFIAILIESWDKSSTNTQKNPIGAYCSSPRIFFGTLSWINAHKHLNLNSTLNWAGWVLTRAGGHFSYAYKMDVVM